MTSYNTNPVNNASVNSTGLLFNVFKGLGLVDHKLIMEIEVIIQMKMLNYYLLMFID